MAKHRRLYVSFIVIALIVLAIATLQHTVPSRVAPGPGLRAAPAASGSESPPLPDFTGGGRWLNSPPLHVADLRGKVVIVDFWTYSCVNCLRTLPYLQDWYARYKDHGLVIVGVHSPEFDFEREYDNVARAVQKYGVTWPVVQDNDYAIWQAYANHYWPHKYIADAQGRVRYDHIGEGGYAETEAEIRSLLQEAGQKLDAIPAGKVAAAEQPVDITRELYAGLAHQQGIPEVDYLGNRPVSKAGDAYVFAGPRTYEGDQFYLIGTWSLSDEAVRYAPPAGDQRPVGKVVLRYQAASVNAVLRSQSGAPVRVQLRLDGQPPGAAQGADSNDRGDLTVQDSRLYNLVHHGKVESHVLELQTDSPDFVLYSFTFSAD